MMKKIKTTQILLRVLAFNFAIGASFAFKAEGLVVNLRSKNIHSMQCFPIMPSQVPQGCDRWGVYVCMMSANEEVWYNTDGSGCDNQYRRW